MDKYLEIKKVFEENSNEENAKQMSAYMRNQFKYYGIKTPARKLLYKDILKEAKLNKEIDWEFLDNCYLDEHREFQYLVLDYLEVMQMLLTYGDICKIKNYIKKKQWWDTIDGFDKIIGGIVLPDKKAKDLMLEWSLDDDFWIRRIAIDHQLNMKDKTNKELLEKIIVNNFGSNEFFINKAIGWSLREYSKTNPDWVREFICKYKGKMAKLSISEASKYI